MPHTVLWYGKASQQRIGPYIVISIRKLPNTTQANRSSEDSLKPPRELVKKHKKSSSESCFQCLARCFALLDFERSAILVGNPAWRLATATPGRAAVRIQILRWSLHGRWLPWKHLLSGETEFSDQGQHVGQSGLGLALARVCNLLVQSLFLGQKFFVCSHQFIRLERAKTLTQYPALSGDHTHDCTLKPQHQKRRPSARRAWSACPPPTAIASAPGS